MNKDEFNGVVAVVKCVVSCVNAVQILDTITGPQLWKWKIQSLQILGQVLLFLQGAAPRPCKVGEAAVSWCLTRRSGSETTSNPFLQQEILRGEDRDLFRMAGLLHRDAPVCCSSWNNLFHLWIPHLWRQPVEVRFTRTSLFCSYLDVVFKTFQILHQ